MWQPLKGKLEEAKQRPYSGPEGPQEELREKTGVCRAAGLRELEIKGKSVLNEASGRFGVEGWRKMNLRSFPWLVPPTPGTLPPVTRLPQTPAPGTPS